MHICTQWITHESILQFFFLLSAMEIGKIMWSFGGDGCKANAIQSIPGFLQGTKIDQENKNSILIPVSIHLSYLQKMVWVIK